MLSIKDGDDDDHGGDDDDEYDHHHHGHHRCVVDTADLQKNTCSRKACP